MARRGHHLFPRRTGRRITPWYAGSPLSTRDVAVILGKGRTRNARS